MNDSLPRGYANYTAPLKPGIATNDLAERVAKSAIAAMFCTTSDHVKVLEPGMTATNRWDAWVSAETFKAVVDAIAAELGEPS